MARLRPSSCPETLTPSVDLKLPSHLRTLGKLHRWPLESLTDRESRHVSQSGARINELGKTAEPALEIPSAFQNPLTQTQIDIDTHP